MKTSSLFIYFTFISSAIISSSSAQSPPEPVRDTAGNPLQTTANYYILPFSGVNGGGLDLDVTRNKTCPLDVIQRPNPALNGLPLTFKPVNQDSVIRQSTDLNIKFLGSTTCVESTIWMLEEYNGQRVVTTGGAEGNPGRVTINNWFKIEKLEDGYKIVFCPTVCDVCRPICGEIGVLIGKNGSRRLVLSDVPFKVRFNRVGILVN